MDIKTELVISSRIYRQGIASYLAECKGIAVSNMYDSIALAQEKIAVCCAEVVILDGHMQDVPLFVSSLKRKLPFTRVILMMFPYDDALFKQCVDSGAEGFITNNDSMEDLVHCITLVHRGHCCYPREFSNNANMLHQQTANDNTLGFNLTSRQTRIVQLIENGMSNKEIARKLGIELATVKNHVHQILERLNVKSRCEAAAIYRRMNQFNLSA